MSEALSPDLVSATTGNYSIPVFAIFSTAWRHIKGIKKAFWQGLGLLFLVMVGLYIVLGFLLAVCDIFYFDRLRAICQFFMGGFIEVFRLLLSISLIFLALSHLRGQTINAQIVFEFRKNYQPLAYMGILAYLFDQMLLSGTHFILHKLTDSGLPGVLVIGEGVWVVLFILLYSYITLLITMAMLLILDKKMQFKDSLKIALISINQHWVKNIVLLILASLLFLLGGIVTLGIGLIWLLPLFFLITAIQYQQIFCASNGQL
jgi:hypothetical protein